MSAHQKPYTLEFLAGVIDAKIQGDGSLVVERLNTLQDASSKELAFLANPKYLKYLETTKAAAVILTEDSASDFSGNALICSDPYLAYAKLTAVFAKPIDRSQGVHATAVVHPSVTLASDVVVGPNAIIGAGSTIADGTVIGAGCSIAEDVSIGANCLLHPNVSVYDDVDIGDDCIIHSGAVIGSDGFGFAPSKEGWVKIHQLGSVSIGDRVEIGSGTTIDRGAIGNTQIANGVIIDDQVHIAHNVKIGENTAIAGCVGIAGSTEIGANCTIAGMAGVNGHITITDNVHIAGMAMVSKSITKPGAYSSATPIDEVGVWRKNAARFHQLDKMARRLSALEKSSKS